MELENVENLTFGELIRAFRRRAKLSQEAFAHCLEKSRRSIIDWEQGTSRPQTKGDLLEIARVARLNEEETVLLLRAGGQDLSPRYWTVNYERNPYFTGRDALLTQLASELCTSRPLVVPHPLALTGLGGIGKTQIALEYAYRFYQQYHAVFWVEASSRDRWVSSYMTIAGALDLPEREQQGQDTIVFAVKRWFQSQSRWLLILDNVEDLSCLREFLPSLRKGHILLTTRIQALGGLAQGLEIGPIEERDSLLFLLRRAVLLSPDETLERGNEADVALGRTLGKELGWLPLALDQAGAYLEETQCGLARYLHLYHVHRATLLQRRGGLATDHPDPVATTWSLSFEKIEQQSPAAADLLRVCAFLDGDAIPEELLMAMINHYTLFNCPSLLEVIDNPLLFDELIQVLRAYSFLQRRGSEHLLSIHRLVQVVLKDALDKDEYQWWAKQMVCAMGLVFPEVEESDAWPQCERFLPHALTCAALIEQEHMKGLENALLVSQTGMYLFARYRLREAELLLLQAFALCEDDLGAEHPVTIHFLTSLASLYHLWGKYDQAEAIFQRALNLFEAELESDHPLIIKTLNDFAHLYRIQGKYRLAMPLLWRAYLLSRQACGPKHMNVARCLASLGALHLAADEFDEAESFYQQALALSEELLGREGYYVAVCLNSVSIIYRQQKKYNEAEPLLLRALSICEKMGESAQSLTVKCFAYLAGIYHMQGRDSEAEPLFYRALMLQEELLGLEHPEVALILGTLAEFYRDQGMFVQAEPLFKRAVALEEPLGKTYKGRIRLLSQYADLLCKMGEEEKAEQIAEQARSIALAQEKPPSQSEENDPDLLSAHQVFLQLELLWDMCEMASRKPLTETERTNVEQVKQLLWLWLEDLENQTQPHSDPFPEELNEKQRSLATKLGQPPFLDLDERPDLRHIPGIGYVSDDFPFESLEEMQVSAWWSDFSFRGFLGYARFLLLLRHVQYLPLSAKDKVAVRKLQKAISAWRADWLEGPLPPIVYTGPAETTIQRIGIAEKPPFRKKFEEIQQLSEHDMLTHLRHPEDIEQINSFRSGMARRFEVVKEQLIEDLKKIGKIP